MSTGGRGISAPRSWNSLKCEKIAYSLFIHLVDARIVYNMGSYIIDFIHNLLMLLFAEITLC